MERPGIIVRRGFDDTLRWPAADLNADAFSQKLGVALGPAPKMRAFLAEAFDPHFAFVATRGGRLMGLAGFKVPEGTFVNASSALLRRHYGLYGRLWRGALLSVIDRKASPHVLTMDGIVVAPGARGLGVGISLIRAVVEEAERRHCRAVRLDVIETNRLARALYERLGFAASKTVSLGPLRHVVGFARSSTTLLPVNRPSRREESGD